MKLRPPAEAANLPGRSRRALSKNVRIVGTLSWLVTSGRRNQPYAKTPHRPASWYIPTTWVTLVYSGHTLP